jgi:hypothetical protein
VKARRHDLTGDKAALNERLERRSARLNDLETKRLEREIARSSIERTARAAGVSIPAIEGARYSGASTPTTIAAVRAWLGGLP